MGLTLRRGITERYLPDIGDNHARARRGDTDLLIAELSEPTVRVWRRYQGELLRRRIAESDAKGIPIEQTEIPALDDEAEGDLFVSCVRRFEGLVLEDGTVIETGAQFWALRHELSREDAGDLVTDLLAAILYRSRLTAGAVQALQPGSGWPASPAQTDGTAATVAVEA